MKDTLKIRGDIMAPVDVKWSALSGDGGARYRRRPQKTRTRRK
jgi:hypothetical protein